MLQYKKSKLHEENLNANKLLIEQNNNELREKENKKKLAQEAYNLWLQLKVFFN